MSRMRRIVASAAMVGVIAGMAMTGSAFAQSASDSGSASSTAATGSKFIFGDTSEPSSLNPMVGYLATDYTLWAMTYDIPINFSTKDFSPDLEHSTVLSVDASADNMTFTYTIRDGMKWSDGQPFTANDFAWTLNFYKQHNISNYSADVRLIDNVTVTDDTHFVIHATQPTSVYSGKTVFLYDYILPEHIWSKLDEPKKFQNVPAVGSGPYYIASYQQGQAVTLKRNPYYWGLSDGLTPTFDEVIYQNFNDENQEAAALQNGEVDFAMLRLGEHPEFGEGQAQYRDASRGRPRVRRARLQHRLRVPGQPGRRIREARRREPRGIRPGVPPRHRDGDRQADARGQSVARLRDARRLSGATGRDDGGLESGTRMTRTFHSIRMRRSRPLQTPATKTPTETERSTIRSPERTSCCATSFARRIRTPSRRRHT